MRAVAVVESFPSPRAWAFTLLGIHEFLRRRARTTPGRRGSRSAGAKLHRLWARLRHRAWPWFEPIASYDNARLSQALLLSGQALPIQRPWRWASSACPGWHRSSGPQGRHFRPIGSNGFYERGGARADFDQQPVEAQAMVSACLEAFRATQDVSWSREAKRAFEWFLGRNDLGLPLYDSGTGGCGDGLHEARVNENQGAESTLAFQLSRVEMSVAEHVIDPRRVRPDAHYRDSTDTT